MAPRSHVVPSASRRSVARRAALTVAGLLAAAAALPAAAAASTVEVTPPSIDRPLQMKRTTVRVAIKNTSKRALRDLSVTVRPPKGVRVRVAGAKKGTSTRRLKTLRAGRTTRISVGVQRLKGGPTSGTVSVRVKRKRKNLASERIRFGVPRLTGRYFWGSTFTLNGIRQETLYFATDGLVYTDDLEGAWATCPAEDAKCRPYQYSEDGKTLVIDGKPAEISGRSIGWDGQRYSELGVPPAGTRWAARMTYSNSSGICPLYCSYFTEHLQFNADGTFVRGALVSGSSPVVDWASVPADQRGTYEVGADGLLRMAFADGKMRTETIGVYVNDDGTLKSPTEGMILNGDGYFDITKD